MQNCKENTSRLMLLISLFLHVILLAYLFLAIFQPQMHNFFPKINNPPFTAPIIFSQPQATPPITAAPKSPVLEPRTSPQEDIPVAQIPAGIPQLTKPLNSAHKPSSSSTNHQEKKDLTSKETTPTPEKKIKPQKTPSTSILEKTDLPALFALPQEPVSSPLTKHHETDHSGLRNKKLTLQDLFKDLLPASDANNENTTADGMLIISQGDMKYCSFLQKFITHINQVFSFHGGPALAHQWARQGNLKKNAALSVVIDKQGKVLDAKITQSSGYNLFDELSLKTVYQSSPFPPIPDRLKHDKVRVDLSSYL